MRMSNEMERLSLQYLSPRIACRSDDPTGSVRVAVTEGPGNFWVLPTADRLPENLSKDHWSIFAAQWSRLTSHASRRISPFSSSRPTNPDLIVAKLGRLHIYTVRVRRHTVTLYGVPAIHVRASEAPDQSSKTAPQVDDTVLRSNPWTGARWRASSASSTNSSIGVLYAVERGAGIGFLPTVVDRAGRAAGRRRCR